ncbi:MAG: BrnT family toxin [Acidobacteriota bacterium]
MQFEWDKEKAEANFSKHGVSFDEAKTVFDDLFSVELFDPDHSDEENCFLIVGESNQQTRLIVSYTERGNTIRIISARSLTHKERRDYEYGTFE